LKEGAPRGSNPEQWRTLDEFDFSFQTSVSQKTIRDLATLGFVEARENLVFLGPPGVGKSHLAIALGIEAVTACYNALFITMDDLAHRMYASLADASLAQYIRSLLRNDLIVIDEVGYLTLDKTASDHLFQAREQGLRERLDHPDDQPRLQRVGHPVRQLRHRRGPARSTAAPRPRHRAARR